MLVAGAVFSGAGAEASDKVDLTQTAVGFSLRYNARTGGGKSEIWSLKLQPDGHMIYMGNHLPDAPSACSPEGGHFETPKGPPNHVELVELAIDAAREQAELAKKPEYPADTSGRYAFTLETEFGEQVESSRVVDTSAPKMARFQEEAKKLYPDLFKSPFRALSVSAAVDRASGAARLTFKNIGVTPVHLVLPEKGIEAFQLRGKVGRTPLEYRVVPKNKNPQLAPKASTSVELALPKGQLPEGTVLVYDNSAILHHGGAKDFAQPLTLCSPIRK